eukprot:m.110478 g.110478  ORF g.110478 m.110478 type:complete len:184 (-) comp28045_c0_seq2:598-1149(-)
MSCVWVGILESLKANDFVAKKVKIDHFVDIITSKNRKVTEIMCNNIPLKESEIEENYRRIEQISSINTGYLCSASDPLMFLISQIYSVDIVHEYCGVTIHYEHTVKDPVMTICYISNTGHFWYNKRATTKPTKKQSKKPLTQTSKETADVHTTAKHYKKKEPLERKIERKKRKENEIKLRNKK